jgi:hypothetical protein
VPGGTGFTRFGFFQTDQRVNAHLIVDSAPRKFDADLVVLDGIR